jgi:hypothetical protein
MKTMAVETLGMLEDHLNCIELTRDERSRMEAMRDVWATVVMVADGTW